MIEISIKKKETSERAPSLRRLQKSTRKSIIRIALLLLILILSAALRFNNVDWDESHMLHPDERYVGLLTGQLKPPASFADFLDSGKSTINPFNTDWGRGYVYGTMPVFIVNYTANTLDQACGKTPAFIPSLLAHIAFGNKADNCNPGTFASNLIMLEGRMWSALADTLSVFLLFLIGKRLFGWRTGMLAAALCGMAVMLIQQAHFFTVDSTANLFITLAIYGCAITISAQQNTRRMLGGIVIAGIATGFALASKISAWPLVPLIVLSVIIPLLRDRRPGLMPAMAATAALLISGGLTFATFRIGQPYAFIGPNTAKLAENAQACKAMGDKDTFGKLCGLTANLPPSVQPVLTLSATWLGRMQEADRLASGQVDIPFGHQWTNRAPITFPLINFVFWGAGIPLGLAIVIGYFWALYRLIRGKRWWAYLLPVLWVGLYFLYQGTQHVKAMRYLLPLYPLACLCAAIGLMALWRAWRPSFQIWRIKAKALRFIPQLLMAAVLVGSAVWALAFSQIYAQPVTRIQASDWIWNNVPTAATLTYSEAGKDHSLFLNSREIKAAPNQPAVVNLSFWGDLIKATKLPSTLTQVSFALNKVTGSGEIIATLRQNDAVIAQTRAPIIPDTTPITFNDLTLDTTKQYQLELAAASGTGFSARTSAIGNEHWDDGLPISTGGRNTYGDYYTGLKSSSDGQIQNYGEDEPTKLPLLLNWLDDADYLSLSSNRLYASIPRLPWRFPMTTEYYRALFSGELGFELVADFNSFPRIGPFVFNDQEMPQNVLARPANTQGTPQGISVPYPTAEEAFSVYDHPRVLIFKKTAAYSRQNAETILGKFDLTRRVVQIPLKAAASPHGLLLDDVSLAVQQANGTWSELFPATSLLNQSQVVAVLVWLLFIELFGLIAFPILYRSGLNPEGAHTLVDGGYAFAKVTGLVVVSVVAWWLASIRIAFFSAGLIWLILVLFACASGIVAWKNRAGLIAFAKSRRSVLLTIEFIFLLAFAFWLAVRIANPDLWHPGMGGEKPMDFAYFNAILKSSYFPPMDPWFAEGSMNYYYLGWVIFGTPVKALGIDPSIAYNLVIPTLAALTAAGAAGVATTLANSRNKIGAIGSTRLVIIAAILGAVFVVFIGNGDEIRTLIPAWQQLGNGNTLAGIGKWLSGTALPIRLEWPYWNPTRLTQELPIAEFPAFTFLFADLHAHMMSMPIVTTAIGFIMMFAAGVRRWYAILLGALVVGALWPVNTWDYPIYALLGAAALVLGVVNDPSARSKHWLVRGISAIPAVVIFLVLTRAFYIPYLENYGSAYTQLDPWVNERTPINAFITIYATFAIPIVAWLGRMAWRSLKTNNAFRYLIPGGLTLGLLAGFALANRTKPDSIPIAVLALPLALVAFAAMFRPGASGQNRLLWLMATGAWLITLFVEVFTLRGDIGRMNTVFKFYIQAWILLGITGAVTLSWMAQAIRAYWRVANSQPQPVPPALARGLAIGFGIIMSVALFLAALYPAFAIPAKTGDRYVAAAPKGLDGMAYMPLATRLEGQDGKQGGEFSLKYDYDAIRWMQANIKGSPTIMEGTTGGAQYRWGNRFSIYTGLPAVQGWEWHERQQRGSLDDRVVFDRNKDVADFYGTPDINVALRILRRYNVRYVTLGDLEKLYGNAAGLPKFDALVTHGNLRLAYQNPGTSIYEVIKNQ